MVSLPVVSWFQAFKLWLLELVHLSRDAAHALVGLLLLGAVFFLRRSPPTWRCLIPTVVVGLAGEGLDLWDAFRYGSPVRLADAGIDIVLTVVPAFVLLVVVMCRHRLTRSH